MDQMTALFLVSLFAALCAFASLVLSIRNHRERNSTEELRAALAADLTSRLYEILGSQGKLNRDDLGVAIRTSFESVNGRLDQMRETVAKELAVLRDGNDRKLEEMRKTVDEKLQSTLERRLGDSFKLVSDRLEAVQRGLGEMQSLATGVGDLKRVLSNVKSRGTWGEVQLGAILEQILTSDQFVRNIVTRPGSRDAVEFAVSLPGGAERNTPIYLPIDSKFPQEDYLRIVDAAERGVASEVESAKRDLFRAIRKSAEEIAAKYLEPPHTTDFGILFLPTEGLYAEVIREAGLVDELQQRCRIIVAGPTTLAALLNTLRVGFKTLAIERRAGEVWQVLQAVRTEFGKFGEVLRSVQTHLDRASKSIHDTGVRTRAMERKLRDVETLPDERANEILGLGTTLSEFDDPIEDEAVG